MDEWRFLGKKHIHAKAFRAIYKDLLKHGKQVNPRGMKIIEIEDYSFTLPPFVRFQNFPARKMNLKYLKDEFLWYLKGDRFDTSITDKAQIWKNIVNSDGSLNSNYGQYIFGQGNQFDRVVNILANDRDSRRASVVILSRDHILSDTSDLPCTYGMNFRIRQGELNMSVHMRSQDAIYGMGNDIPTFSFIHEMVLNALRRTYPKLVYGAYYHAVDSFHVYEKHFKMLTTLVDDVNEQASYELVLCPPISGPDEVDFIRALDFSNIPKQYEFATWLTTR